MAKRIIWTEQAIYERNEILTYWASKIGNKKHSTKLALEFKETVKYIATYNYLGRQTELVDVRVAVSGHYLIFYNLAPEAVYIISIFDNRRNPQDLDI